MSRARHLDWEGCFNVRDLGGLVRSDGRAVRRGSVVRADRLDRLTTAGWAALWEHGVRTVIDLRNDDELGEDAAPRPAELTTLHLPLDAIEERAFWERWLHGPEFGTPLYYRPHLERFPDRSARVLSAVARAQPGGVAVHCSIGRDRTGMISALLLGLAGILPEQIGDDYAQSNRCLRERWARLGEPDQGPAIDAFLQSRGTNAAELVIALATARELPDLLAAGGLTREEIALLTARLLDETA
jgi:protein-tyrosine phosphatase